MKKIVCRTLRSTFDSEALNYNFALISLPAPFMK